MRDRQPGDLDTGGSYVCFQFEKHPPVHAVIWDLDGMIIQLTADDDEMSVADLEELVQFILALCQSYSTTILSHRPALSAIPYGRFEKLFLALEDRRWDDYLTAAHRLEVSPQHSVVIAVDPKRLNDAGQMGFQTVAFQNPRQAVSELLPLLAEPLAV